MALQLDVITQDNKKQGSVEVSEAVFGHPYQPHLFQQVVRWQLAARRQGTHKTLDRSEVRGGGRKPYRQKGTGNARQGSIRSAQWVGGSTVFGPKPKSYAFSLNKKVRAKSLAIAISQKIREKKWQVVDQFTFSAPNTKTAKAMLEKLGVTSALFIDGKNDNLRLSVRNLDRCKYIEPMGLNLYDLLNHDAVVVAKAALAEIEKRCQRGLKAAQAEA